MSEEAISIDELTKEPCSPDQNELDSPEDDDLSGPDPECKKKEAAEEHQVECTGEEEASLDGEEKNMTTENSPEECPIDGQSLELPAKVENDCASKDNNIDELYDKLSSSSPEPGELPDDDDLTRANAKNIKKEPRNGSDSENPFEEVKLVKERNTSEDDIPMKIKKEQNDSVRVKRESISADDSWEEQTGSPDVKQGFYSDLEDYIPPKTPELKPLDKAPEPAKKLAGIFEKKVKKEEGSSEGILQEKLKQYFGHNDFKSALQKEAIQTIIASELRSFVTLQG